MSAIAVGVREAVRRMTAYTLQTREADLKLNQNESPFDLPSVLKERILAAAAEMPWNVYPDFAATRLREALSRAFGIPVECVLAGNGSNDLIASAVAAFVEPGMRVAVLRPSFALYEKLVTVAGGEVVGVSVDPRTGELPLDLLVEAVERRGASVVILCSPNNPTGGVLRKGGIERLLATGAIVLFDRAYGDFDGDALPPPHERLVVFSTLSKAWGLAGLRVGWLYSKEETSRELRKVVLPYSVNRLSEAVGIAALEQRAYRDSTVESVVLERERLFTALDGASGIEPFPSRANFVTFRCSIRSARFVFGRLCADGVLIRDVSSYPGLEECLRVSVGKKDQNDRFIVSLRAAMEEL